MADILQISDLTERFEELETELLAAFNEQQKDEACCEEEYTEATDTESSLFIEWAETREHMLHAEQEEYNQIKALLEELKGCGGDEQWRGDWYPQSLINDDYFETAMDELVSDIGDIPKNLPSYLTITIDYDALQQDYSQVDYDGDTYWYR